VHSTLFQNAMCCGGRKLQHFLKLYESFLNSRGKGPTNKSKKRMSLDVRFEGLWIKGSNFC